jgi:hypothetical protein
MLTAQLPHLSDFSIGRMVVSFKSGIPESFEAIGYVEVWDDAERLRVEEEKLNACLDAARYGRRPYFDHVER